MNFIFIFARKNINLALVVVLAEEIKKRGHAFLVMEHFCREMPIEELDSVSDGFRERWLRERSGEGREIQLQNKVSISTAPTQNSNNVTT